MQYFDFDLTIGLGSGPDYPVALRSPAGAARGVLRLPFDEVALRDRLKDLQIALLRSGGPPRRRIESPEEMAVQDFGQRLFDALIAGDLRPHYDATLQLASQHNAGVRLKLHIQAPELAALPWEYLYDTRLGEYLSLSRSTPLVRTLDTFLPIQPFNVQPPLRILGMIASPSDFAALDVAREKERMRAALQPLEQRGLVRLKWLEGQTWRDLQRAMLGGPWHIFHFSGHGGFDPTIDEGVLAFADEQGKAHLLRAAEVGRLLADHPPLRLAVLNACEGARGGKRDIFSSTAATLARRGIPAVIAMQEEVTDPAAIELTRTLYEALAASKPIDEALTIARTAISLSIRNTLEWGTPVLYLRAPDGMLFNLPPQLTPTSFPAVPQPVQVPPSTPPRVQQNQATPATPLIRPQGQATPARPPVSPPVFTPQQPVPVPRKSGAPRAAAIVGALRALGGAGVGFLLGLTIGGDSTALGYVGLALGGACGIGLAVLEGRARQGASSTAVALMRVERALFAAALGLLLGLAFFSSQGAGVATAAAIVGALLGGALSFAFMQMEKAGQNPNRRGLYNFVRVIRTFFKGGIGILGGLTLGSIVGIILVKISPPTSSGSTSGSPSDALGNAIGLALAAAAEVTLLAVLGGLVGLIVGLIAGAFLEFRSK